MGATQPGGWTLSSREGLELGRFLLLMVGLRKKYQVESVATFSMISAMMMKKAADMATQECSQIRITRNAESQSSHHGSAS